MKRYFVTGTNTDVGKTIVSALLCEHLKADYFKPIQTGSGEILDANTVAGLTNSKIHPNAYCLKVASSPQFAANQEGINIDINTIELPKTENNLIVEGAGGILVPINDKHTTIDLIRHLNIPVIIVSKNELGTVSSTLATIEVLKFHKIEIAGVIMNGDYDPFDNVGSIEHFSGVEVLDKIKKFDKIDKESIKNYKLSEKLLKKLL